MDDLGEKLAGILNDPESMERVRTMAESILVGEQNKQNQNPFAALTDGFDTADLNKILGIVSKLKSKGDDASSNLLLSLKPHLSEPRQQKVDTAIKILKLLDLLPYLKESGLLNF